MFMPPLSPVSQAMKCGLPWNSSSPSELIEKPVVGVAPTSHWNCVVGARESIMLAVPSLFHGIESMILTRQDAATSVGVGDAAVWANAKLGRRQTMIADAVLSIRELANGPRATSRRSQVEAASIAAANEGVGTSCQSCQNDEVLHGAEKLKRGFVNE